MTHAPADFPIGARVRMRGHGLLGTVSEIPREIDADAELRVWVEWDSGARGLYAPSGLEPAS